VDYIRGKKGAKDLKPMIIFAEEIDKQLETDLAAAVRHTFNNQLFLIKEEKDITKLFNIIKNTKFGAVLIDKKFGRGLNLRFEQDSEVIVLVNKEIIPLQLVIQMVGRSSRRQGCCFGRVFIVTEYDLSNSQDGALEQLTIGQDDLAEDEGQMIVKALFAKLRLLSADMKISFKEMVGKTPEWRTRREEFAQKKTEVLKFLKEPTYVPVNW
jgi:hypothetical protein